MAQVCSYMGPIVYRVSQNTGPQTEKGWKVHLVQVHLVNRTRAQKNGEDGEESSRTEPNLMDSLVPKQRIKQMDRQKDRETDRQPDTDRQTVRK